jgi:hypothetical protein
MGCFARNSALSEAVDPDTDDLLFDIVIYRCGARADRRPLATQPLRIRSPLPVRILAHFGCVTPLPAVQPSEDAVMFTGGYTL